jgi:large subunit ribosomal protein L37e
MTKGTPSMGKKNKEKVVACRRCGKVSYNLRHNTCSHCGFGASSKMRNFAWAKEH